MTHARLRRAHVVLAAGLLLTPMVLILDWAGLADELVLFVLAGLALLPLSSLVGSVAGNLLLVLGLTLLLGRQGPIDRRSAHLSLGLVGFATVLVLVAAAPGFHGDENRRSLAELS